MSKVYRRTNQQGFGQDLAPLQQYGNGTIGDIAQVASAFGVPGAGTVSLLGNLFGFGHRKYHKKSSSGAKHRRPGRPRKHKAKKK